MPICPYSCLDVLLISDHCRAVKDILSSQEVFVDYGPEYAAELGINPQTYNTFEGTEKHKTSALACPSCVTSFSTQQFLDEHLKHCVKKNVGDNEQQGPVKIPCMSSTCDKFYTRKLIMMEHYRREHLGMKIPCTEASCCKVFGTTTNMRRHYKSVHLLEKRFKCMTCGETFTRGSSLKMHVDQVHLSKRNLCADCGATFGTAQNLKRHIGTEHSSVTPQYPCSLCSATYASNAKLLLHMMDHTGEPSRTFECPYESCSAKFKAQHMVNKHIRTAKKHSGDRLASESLRPFSCQVGPA